MLLRHHVRTGIDAHGARLRQVHDRCRKVVSAFPVPTPQAADNGRVHALTRHIAPILLREVRLVLFAVAEEHDDSPNQRRNAYGHACCGERQRHHALAIRGIRPSLLLFQDRVQALLAGMQALRAQRNVRQPLRGDAHAHLGIFARFHAGNRARDRPIGVNGNAAAERAMAPRMHVLARIDRNSLGKGKLKRGRHVLGRNRPGGA